MNLKMHSVLIGFGFVIEFLITRRLHYDLFGLFSVIETGTMVL